MTLIHTFMELYDPRKSLTFKIMNASRANRLNDKTRENHSSCRTDAYAGKDFDNTLPVVAPDGICHDRPLAGVHEPLGADFESCVVGEEMAIAAMEIALGRRVEGFAKSADENRVRHMTGCAAPGSWSEIDSG